MTEVLACYNIMPWSEWSMIVLPIIAAILGAGWLSRDRSPRKK